jgi:hypothetical protein
MGILLLHPQYSTGFTHEQACLKAASYHWQSISLFFLVLSSITPHIPSPSIHKPHPKPIQIDPIPPVHSNRCYSVLGLAPDNHIPILASRSHSRTRLSEVAETSAEIIETIALYPNMSLATETTVKITLSYHRILTWLSNYSEVFPYICLQFLWYPIPGPMS